MSARSPSRRTKRLRLRSYAELRRRIDERGETLAAFAARVGLHPSALYTANEQRAFQLSTARKIAAGLGVKAGDLFEIRY